MYQVFLYLEKLKGFFMTYCERAFRSPSLKENLSTFTISCGLKSVSKHFLNFFFYYGKFQINTKRRLIDWAPYHPTSTVNLISSMLPTRLPLPLVIILTQIAGIVSSLSLNISWIWKWLSLLDVWLSCRMTHIQDLLDSFSPGIT